MKIKEILHRLLLLLLPMAGTGEAWAVSRTISWQAVSRITNNNDGSFTTASNAGNVYALAIADLSSIDGIGTVGTVNIQFYCQIPSGSRWLIGIGDKSTRGTTANGSSKDNYNTDGLYMRFGEAKENNTFNVNGVETVNSSAVGVWVQVNFSYNRIAHTYSYSLKNPSDNYDYYSATDVPTSVSSPTIIEAYSWRNNTSIDIHNVTVTFNDFYFPHGAEIAYIEDISYTLPLFNSTGQTPTYSFSTTDKFRQDGATLYPKATTGLEPDDLWEGNAITITANAQNQQATTFYLRLKTRGLIDPDNLCTTNFFDAGTSVGMLSSNTCNLDGLTLSFSKSSDIPVIRSISGDYAVTVIDGNGYNFGNIVNDIMYGSVYKLETTAAKKLHVTGYFSDNNQSAQLIFNGSQIGTIANPGDGSLATGTFDLQAESTYYLYAPPYTTFCLKSLSYTDAYFEQAYDITAIPADGHYLQTVRDMFSPVYSIVGIEGDLALAGVTINSSTGLLSGLTAGGAVKVQATGGGKTCVYYLTVAYPATPYPGKLWEFNQYYSPYQPPLSIDETGGLSGFPRIDANSDGTVIMTDGGPNTITDEHGETWMAELKNVNYGSGRDARWRHVNAVHGDNAFIVSETAGLVFNTGGKGFFVRNDRTKYNCWAHVGIRQYGASFTIPQLVAGDIIEINWKRESGGAGGEFSATNVTDLRGKPVSEQFEITGSQNGITGGQGDIYKNPGYTSFIATGGDVTFTLRDGGATDILSIRIYNGGYRTTMRPITGADHRTPQTTMLLDYKEDEEDNNYMEYEYNYCNVLNSTNTGPAIYVLKGYRRGEDNVECVSGTNAAHSPTSFEDNDADYPAYPVKALESERLYDLRKNLVGFRMYNRTWQSSRNSYNNGKVGASGGWGKVTIRMNNYTNDMKYVIGYTNDVTMTFGSAPHQTYPYTWDFGNISMQQVLELSDNALNSIEAEGSNSHFSGMSATNWEKNSSDDYILNTDNNGEYGSQYVPGAILVSIDKALSKYPQGTASTTYALDELDGFGVTGEIAMQMDKNSSSWNRTAPDVRMESLLSMKVSDYIVTNEETEEWSVVEGDELMAGNGSVQFANKGKIEESDYSECHFGYRSDQDAGNNKWILLKPSRAIAQGDIITVKSFTDMAPDGNTGVGVFTQNLNDNQVTQLSVTQRFLEQILTYTIPAGSELIGKSQFYLNRANSGKTVLISEVEVTGIAGNLPKLDKNLYAVSDATITIPDLNADGKQDWIYVSSSAAPMTVTNATRVTGGADGPDANQNPMVEDVNTHVYKYKVTDPGNSDITFAAGTRIYKIGVTHILKEIHPVGGVGWATEIRNHEIDHELIGYFTKNDVNAYTVKYDSYDMNTATVALTPINEDGYVPTKTGIVMRLDNAGGLSDANDGKYVPLFYPSYTRPKTTTPVDFPDNNMMYQDDNGIDNDNRNYNETYSVGGINYTKFILTNFYWTFDKDHSLNNDEVATSHTAEAAGFYRMHIWKTTEEGTKNTMPAHTAYLLVPSDKLPAAVWTLQSGYSAARGDLLGVYNIIGPGSETAIENVRLIPEFMTNGSNADGEETWYTVSGMKLSTRPTQPGLYIYNNRKVVIK